MGEQRPELAGLRIACEPDAWRTLGFAVDREGRCQVGRTTLTLCGRAAGDGILGWRLRHVAPPGPIDGLPTETADPELEPPAEAGHPNGALRLDHVVLATPALARTQAALADVGFDLRRTRDVPRRALRQAFYRMGEVVLEVVGPPERATEGPPSLWGLVVVVPELDAFADAHPELVGPAHDAVQPGRRIAAARPAARLGTHVAFMSP
jgi:hypothetical protein